MTNKIKIALGSASVALGSLAMQFAAHAQVVVPTSTQSGLTALAGQQISDPGTLAVVVLAAGTPFAFYIIGRLLGLIPGRHSGKRA
jgi:hypothetical protein